VLREGVDYYLDPSQLWFALVRPLNQGNERLAVAYTLLVNGVEHGWCRVWAAHRISSTRAGERPARQSRV
jgi:hypothetical protein